MSPAPSARSALAASALVVVLAVAFAAPGLAIPRSAAQPSADPPPPSGAPPVPPPAAPTTVASQTVLPGVLSTAWGVALDARVDLTRFSEDFASPAMFAVTLHGQYISALGVGGYAALPIAYVKEDHFDGSYVGNAELGALYVLRRPGIEAYVRSGITLPQIETSGDEAGEVTPAALIVPRPADALPSGFSATWARFGGGFRVVSGALVLGGALGFDRPIQDDRDWLSDMFHMSGWVGFSRRQFGGAFGVSLLQTLDDGEGFGPDPTMMVVYGTGDAAVGRRVRVYGTVGVSLNDRDAVSVGVGARLGI